MANNNIITTEQVWAGHPDKLCDILAEMIVDTFLEIDKNARVAIEVMIKGDTIIIGGEISHSHPEPIIKNILLDFKKNNIGTQNLNLDKTLMKISYQSPEIAKLVKNGDLGAGDNTIAFGYACNSPETNYIPKPVWELQQMAIKHHQLVKDKINTVGPDGKAIIYWDSNTKEYSKIDLSQQIKEQYKTLSDADLKTMLPKDFDANKVNLTTFYKGGSDADCGVTGRKLMCATYGAFARHGGGNFSGKDPTKSDKTLALWARLIAKNLIKKFNIAEVEVQITSKIGQTKDFPIKIFIPDLPNKCALLISISHWLKYFEKRTYLEIINVLRLKTTKMQNFAKFGYFGWGKNSELIECPNWEKTIYA